MYDVSIARLIPIIKLSYCTMRKGRERSKCYSILLYSVMKKKIENQKKKIFFFSNWDFFSWNWEKNILFGIGNGAEFQPQNRVIESPDAY